MEEYQGFWKQEQELRQKEAAADDLPRVKLTTTKGDIVIELFENEAPETVGNFLSLVKKGFYDGLTFHRVIAGFMAQAAVRMAMERAVRGTRFTTNAASRKLVSTSGVR